MELTPRRDEDNMGNQNNQIERITTPTTVLELEAVQYTPTHRQQWHTETPQERTDINYRIVTDREYVEILA